MTAVIPTDALAGVVGALIVLVVASIRMQVKLRERVSRIEGILEERRRR